MRDDAQRRFDERLRQPQPEIDRLRVSNAALLAALREILGWYDGLEMPVLPNGLALAGRIGRARAAIQRAS